MPDWWKYTVDVAQILSAIGTCGAVIVSLWIAQRRPKPSLQASAGLRQVYGCDHAGDEIPEYLTFQVTNIGNVDCVVSSFSWRTGYFKHRWAYQKVEYSDLCVQSWKIPTTLSHGQSAMYFIPAFGNDCWFERLSKPDDLFAECYPTRRSLRSLRLIVTTSVGVSYSIKPESSVLDRMWENIKKAKA